MKKQLLYTLAIVLSLSSCGNREAGRILSDVESYIQERPDSALAVLRGIDKSTLGNKRLQAKYSLLEAMAYDKNYIDTTDISVIAPAVEYYSRHGNADDRLKALFYQGVIYYNRQEYEKAIVSFSRAEELVPKASDKKYIGLLFSSISSTYGKTHNAVEELRYIQLAERSFLEAGLTDYYSSTVYRIAQALHNTHDFADAECKYLAVLSDTCASDDLKRNAKEDYALLLVVRPDRNCQKALDLFTDVISEGNGLRSINLWSAYAYTLAACGQNEEAEKIFTQLYGINQSDYSIIDIWKSVAYESEGNYKDAYKLLQKSLTYQDSLLNLSISQAMVRAQRDYLALDKNQLEIANNTNRIRSLSIIIILVVLILIVYIVSRNKTLKLEKDRSDMAQIADSMRIRLKESEENRELEISSLQEQIDKSKNALSILRSEYARMYKSQFKCLGELCETYFLASSRTDSQIVVYNKVRSIIKDISGDESGQKRFEQMINKSLDGIMQHFREDFPNFTEDDYRFVSYLFVGFDATTITVVLNMPSLASVYTRKSRIKKSIQDSLSVNREYYLGMIS